MVSNRITEGVGKKIVEALKQQSDIEIQSVVDNPVDEDSIVNNSSNIEFVEQDTEQDEQNTNQELQSQEEINSTFDENLGMHNQFTTPGVMPLSQQHSMTGSFESDSEEFEIPANIAVLKQLINQLPAGVSKQTGAQIIKQTMEALGISMKSVLQEAQQVQESLNNASRECQTSIMEYKKQIGLLERQSQKLQKQYATLNDIISLFIQTNI